MSLFKKKKDELSYLIFEVTRQCNLDCQFCYNHWKRDNDTKSEPEKEGYTLALKTLKTVFKQANPKHVTFTGGEPLLAERVNELILFCRMKGATVSVITNGNTGSTTEFSQLIKVGVQLFELPLHSYDQAVHDRMTGVLGSWKKSKDRMVGLMKFGAYVVPVIVITKQNFSQVGETLELLNNLGFQRVMLNRYNLGGAALASPEKVLPSKEELNEAFKQANEIAEKRRLQLSSNVCTPHCVVDPNRYRNILFSNCSTDIRQRPLTLTVGGDLRFCNHSPDVMGNIYRETIHTILEKSSEKYSVVARPDFCTGCIRYEKCRGGCRAAAQQTGGSFNDVDPLVNTIKEIEETEIV
jgi:radical SAM protein with 4Fe4S-binding SPASM domain